MATRREANVVYAAGLVQGIVLVTFPAASTIFTDPAQYDLSSTQYGTMFFASAGASVELLIGINAEGKSLEDVTRPLTAAND
jgi:hypothetical protein